MSAIDYNNYIDGYGLGLNFHLIHKITFFYLQYWPKSRNETLKQTLILAIAKTTVLIVTVSVPHTANVMPIHMVKVSKGAMCHHQHMHINVSIQFDF